MSSLKRYNTQTSQWEYVAIGKQGITGTPGVTGPTGPTGPTPDISGKANLSGATFTGTIIGSPNTTASLLGSNDTGSFSVRSNNVNSAAMSFHRTGAYAINMGLDTDNAFKIGGWSAGNTRFQINSAGAVAMPNQPVATGRFSCTANSGLANLWQPNRQVGITFSGSRITVPTAGLYLIGLQHISNNGSGRLDTNIFINGGLYMSALNPDNVSGFRYKSLQVVVYMNGGDYIEFNSQSWYNAPNFEEWKTFFVTMIS
jgi:hypothetical protein